MISDRLFLTSIIAANGIGMVLVGVIVAVTSAELRLCPCSWFSRKNDSQLKLEASNTSIHRFFRAMTAFSIYCNLGQSIVLELFFIGMLYDVTEEAISSRVMACLNTATYFWALGKIGLQAVYIGRLHYTFEQSNYRASHISIRLLIIVLVIILILQILWSILTSPIQFQILTITLVILNFIYTSLLLYMFNYRLLQLVSNSWEPDVTASLMRGKSVPSARTHRTFPANTATSALRCSEGGLISEDASMVAKKSSYIHTSGDNSLRSGLSSKNAKVMPTVYSPSAATASHSYVRLSDISLSTAQKKIIKVTTKSVLLGSIAVGYTFFASAIFVIATYGSNYAFEFGSAHEYVTNSHNIWWILDWTTFVLDPLVSNLCMALNFSFAEQYYDVACGCCNHCVRKCCLRVAQKLVVSQFNKKGLYLETRMEKEPSELG